MNIGANIKFFRKSKDLTQEELAEQLNVTVSAVSQWESEKTMPDITLLPKLSMIFGVSVDEILGVSDEKNAQKLKEFEEEFKKLYYDRKYTEMVELARKTLIEFPNNYNVMYNLAFALGYLDNYMADEVLDEQIKLCEYILSKCTDNKIRLQATDRLCWSYAHKGDNEKALYYIEQLPDTVHNTQFRTKRALGLVPPEDVVLMSQYQIDSLYWLINEYAFLVADVNYENPCQKISVDERIKIMEILITVTKTIYGEKLADKNFEMYELYRIVGALYLFDGKEEKALDNFEVAYKYAVDFEDNFNDKVDHYSSPLINLMECAPKRCWEGTPCHDLLDRFLNQQRYDKIRDNPRFIKLVENLKCRT